jgi:hypothetical protein
MNSACELQAVLVGSDNATIDAILPCLSEMGIAPSIHAQTASALQTLTQQKIDAFFVHRELDPEFSLLKRMRNSPSNRRAVAFAIIPERKTANDASRVADFVMDKPLAPVNASRAVRAALGRILKQRKRYFRNLLRAPIHLTDSTYRKFDGQTLNLSQTGIALECATPFTVRETVQLEFYLPGIADKFDCKAQIIWRAEQGKAGLTFTHMKPADKERLESWIEESALVSNASPSSV